MLFIVSSDFTKIILYLVHKHLIYIELINNNKIRPLTVSMGGKGLNPMYPSPVNRPLCSLPNKSVQMHGFNSSSSMVNTFLNVHWMWVRLSKRRLRSSFAPLKLTCKKRISFPVLFLLHFIKILKYFYSRTPIGVRLARFRRNVGFQQISKK